MGASSDKRISNQISSVLLSFSKIKELANALNSNNKGNLSGFLDSFIKDHNDLESKIEEFKQILPRNFNYNIDNLIKYIIETLHSEFNKKNNNTNWLDEFNKKDKNPSYEEFLKCYKENNDSIIQQLFFGIKEKISKCCECEECDKNYEITKLEKIVELQENKSNVDIRDLFKRLKSLKMPEVKCQKCNNKPIPHIINTNIINLPEILIIYLVKRNDNCIVDYYLQCEFMNEQYNLICFISNKNENNQLDEQNNVFYKENGNWFVYKIKENRNIPIRDIKKIHGNPLIVFYQKDTTLFNKYYNHISLLLNDQKNILELASEHIIPEIDYENYYLLNKDWFNKIIKIYEPENIYSNDKDIINSIKKVTNVTKAKIKISEFNERIKIIGDENKFKIVDGSVSLETNSNSENKLNYPTNFVLIKENILNDLLKELKISNISHKKYLYPVKFGENLIFIKNNKPESGETIYVCFLNENVLQVGIILVYKEKKYFNKEIRKFISNKGGLEYYYQERKLKVNINNIPQKIIDREDDKIGFLINIINLEDFIEAYKFNTNKIEDIMSNKKDKNIYKMYIFEELKLNQSNILRATNYSNFSKKNYGDNPMNQIKMSARRFIQNIPLSESHPLNNK